MERLRIEKSNPNSPDQQIERWKRCLEKDIPECFELFFPDKDLFGDDQYHRLCCISFGSVEKDLVSLLKAFGSDKTYLSKSFGKKGKPFFISKPKFYLNLAVRAKVDLDLLTETLFENHINIILSVEFKGGKKKKKLEEITAYFGLKNFIVADSTLTPGNIYSPIKRPEHRWELGFKASGMLPRVKNHLCMAWDRVELGRVPGLFSATTVRSGERIGTLTNSNLPETWIKFLNYRDADRQNGLTRENNDIELLRNPFSRQRIRGHKYKIEGRTLDTLKNLANAHGSHLRLSFHLAMMTSSELFNNSGFSAFIDMSYPMPKENVRIEQTRPINDQNDPCKLVLKITVPDKEGNKSTKKCLIELDDLGNVYYHLDPKKKLKPKQGRINEETVVKWQVDKKLHFWVGFSMLLVNERLQFRVVANGKGARARLSVKAKQGMPPKNRVAQEVDLARDFQTLELLPAFVSEEDDFSGLCPPNC